MAVLRGGRGSPSCPVSAFGHCLKAPSQLPSSCLEPADPACIRQYTHKPHNELPGSKSACPRTSCWERGMSSLLMGRMAVLEGCTLTGRPPSSMPVLFRACAWRKQHSNKFS